jgi:hypothetical protein
MKIIQSTMHQIKMKICPQSYLLIKLPKLANLSNKILKKMIKFKTKTKILMMIILNYNIRDSVKYSIIVLTVNLKTVTKKNFQFLKERQEMRNLDSVLWPWENKNNPKILAVHFYKSQMITKKKGFRKVFYLKFDK